MLEINLDGQIKLELVFQMWVCWRDGPQKHHTLQGKGARQGTGM